MVNLLIAVGLSGVAVTYVVEALYLATLQMFNKASMNKYLSLPLSFGALYSFGYLNKQLIVGIPATTFVALVLHKWLNKPTVIERSARRLPQMPSL
jgi:hypothetical protein